MIKEYRIVRGPIGFNVEGNFDVTYKRNWFERIIGVPKGVYGWHLLDQTGHRFYISPGMPIFHKPAIFNTDKKAREFIEWQKSVGEVVEVKTA